MMRSGRRWTERRSPLLLVFFASLIVLALTACAADDPEIADPDPQEEPTEPDPVTADPDPEDECDTPGTCEPSEELISAAQAEGEVHTFSAIAAGLQDEFARAFEEKYGIEVHFAQVQVGEAIERALTEHEAGRVSVDLLNHSNDVAHADFTEMGIYAELDVDELPNLAAIANDPEMFRGTHAFWGGAAWNLAWNTEVIQDGDVPDEWCDLADPKFSGQLGFVDQPGAASVYAVFALIEEVCGEGILEDLAANDIIWFTSTAPLADALTAGEVGIGAPVIHTIVPRKEDGAPVDWKILDGMSIGARYMAIMNDAPNPNAARLFANWLLSEEAQLIAYSNYQGVTVLPDLVTDAIPMPDRFLLASSTEFTPERTSEIRSKLGLE